jgi:hypothetical protein
MAKGSLKVWATVAVTLLSACAAPAPAPSPAPPPPAPTPAPAPPPVAEAPPRPRDSCGASDLQSLVGRPRTEIPVPLNPNGRRVICSTCPMTQDYVSSRQTIIYDASTGLVSSVKCG